MHYNYTTEVRICKAALPVVYVVGSNIVFRFAVFCFFKESAFNISCRCTWLFARRQSFKPSGRFSVGNQLFGIKNSQYAHYFSDSVDIYANLH